MRNWQIEAFDATHTRDAFQCGKPALDDFLRQRVSQYEKRRLGKTFVLVAPPSKEVIGYYTLAAGAIAFEQLPADAAKKLPKHPVPIILLARLAVDQSAHGQKLGESLLLDAVSRCLQLSQSLGVYAVKVDAIDDAAARFYCKYGFVPLVDQQLQFFLPITTVELSFRQ